MSEIDFETDDQSIRAFKTALDIFAKHLEDGQETKYPLRAEHDIILSCVTEDMISPDSEDGKKLDKLGWFVNPDYGHVWAYFC